LSLVTTGYITKIAKIKIPIPTNTIATIPNVFFGGGSVIEGDGVGICVGICVKNQNG